MAISKIAAAFLVATLCHAASAREAASPAACLAAAAEPAILDAEAAAEAASHELRLRFRLADAWSDKGCFADELRVLKESEPLFPRDRRLQERLRLASSVVSEQGYFDKLDLATRDARLARARFRCLQLNELVSCEEALSMTPDDPDLLSLTAKLVPANAPRATLLAAEDRPVATLEARKTVDAPRAMVARKAAVIAPVPYTAEIQTARFSNDAPLSRSN